MSIEELSKSQLLLLTILVNFVTSIATGILTVSFLDNAPAVVTQTINRVVEHTIETVAAAAPAPLSPQAPAPSNQDLVLAAIGAAATRTVGIHSAETGTSTPPLTIGTYVPKARVVVTAQQEGLPKEALIEFTTGATAPASLSRQGNGLVIYGFADGAALPKMSSPTLLSTNDLKLGQTVLALSADGAAATGIVARVTSKGVQATLPDIGVGSAAVDLSGNLIGIASGVTPGFLLPASLVTSLLSATSTATSTAAAR